MRLKDKLYKDCSDLPISCFISLYFDKDISFIVKEKGLIRASKKTLNDKWQDLYQEYNELNSNEEFTAFFIMLKRKTYLENDLMITQMIIDTLRPNYNLDLIKQLKSMGYNFKFSKESFRDDLKKVVTRAKTKVAELNRLKRDIEPFLNGQESTKEDFIDLISVVSKYQGYKISLTETTILEFSIVLKRYKKVIEELKTWQTIKK